MTLGDPAPLGATISCNPWLRQRPFNDTYLCAAINGSPANTAPLVTIYYGNPNDTRSLRKEFYAATPGAGPPYLLGAVAKASVYHGERNEIRITRNPAVPGSQATQETIFTSSLYDSGWDPYNSPCGTTTTTTPPAQLPAQTCSGKWALDVKTSAQKITAVQTLTTCTQLTTTVDLDTDYNIEAITAPGRNSAEHHITTYTYKGYSDNRWIVASISDQEGSAGSLRTFQQASFDRRGEGVEKPFAVEVIHDTTEPSAEQTHQVTLCPATPAFQNPGGRTGYPQYLTFNWADGTSVADEYTNEQYGFWAIGRRVDTNDLQTLTYYNTGVNAGSTTIPTSPDTRYEVSHVLLSSKGQSISESTMLYEKDMIDTYHVPFIYKVISGADPLVTSAIPRSVFHEALYTVPTPMFNAGAATTMGAAPPAPAPTAPFFSEKPWAYADHDGRIHQDEYSPDGFRYWHADVTGAGMVSTVFGLNANFSLTSSDPASRGQSCQETMYRGLAIASGTQYSTAVTNKTLRDRFGHVLQTTDMDTTPATVTYHMTPQGYVDYVKNEVTGDKLTITSWNDTRTAVTGSTFQSANGTVLSQNTLPADSFGNIEGMGSLTRGPLTWNLTSTRDTAGVLLTHTATLNAAAGVTPPTNSLRASYNQSELRPSQTWTNNQPDQVEAPVAAAAKVGCK
jgi:hypothetical protein